MTGLFDRLSRRGVVRVALAYLAIGWLVLQVVNVLFGDGIFELPGWPQYLFYSLLIGFPVVVVLAWIYDITPEGIVIVDDSASAAPPVRFGGRKIDLVIIGSLTLVVALLGGRLIIQSGDSGGGSGLPMASNPTPLMDSPFVFPPTRSPYPLTDNGSELFFNDWNNGQLGLLRLSRQGGEAQRIELPWWPGSRANPYTVTPDGSHLVVGVFSPGSNEPSIAWHVPLAGGAPRRIGQASDISYSDAGDKIVHGSGFADLAISNPDLTDPHVIATTTPRQGVFHWARFSPDGRTIRYSLQRDPRSIFEVAVDGGEPRRLFPDWDVDHCCGNWTPDGEYYVFQATVNGRTQLWALPHGTGDVDIEKRQRITDFALDFRRPTISQDGKRIFAVGWQLQGELVRFDPEIERFAPLENFDDLSAEWARFSPDQEYLAYVTYPEAELVRRRADGGEALTLAPSPMRSVDPVWSPDSRNIAFVGWQSGEAPHIYIVTVDGDTPSRIPVSEESRRHGYPAFSPDGTWLAFNEEGSSTIRTYEIETGVVSDLDGSEGLFAPRFLSNGDFIAYESGAFVFFDIETGSRRVIAEGIPAQNFEVSADGQSLYVVPPEFFLPDRPFLRVSIADGATERMTGLTDDVGVTAGVDGVWARFTPDGNLMLLNDTGLHNVYELTWLAEGSVD